MAKISCRVFRQYRIAILFLIAASGLLMAQEASSQTPSNPADESKSNVLVAESFPSTEPLASPSASSSSMFGAAPKANMPATESLIRPGSGSIAPVMIVVTPKPLEKPVPHPFWDRENRVLFAANSALAGADFFVTRQNLAAGGKELNPVAREFAGSTPALAGNFAMETGGVIGISYLFHKTGHHKLERLTSYVNLSASAFAVSYGLAHH